MPRPSKGQNKNVDNIYFVGINSSLFIWRVAQLDLFFEHVQVLVLGLEQNKGKGEAVRRGMLEGCSTGASYVGYWDSDLATPLNSLHEFQVSPLWGLHFIWNRSELID